MNNQRQAASKHKAFHNVQCSLTLVVIHKCSFISVNNSEGCPGK